MDQKIKGYLKLTRFNEYVYFVIVTTLLGVAAARGEFNLRFVLVLIANLLSVGFAFMINDVEDAPDDALNEEKINRNPVSAGMLSVREAKTASFLVMLVSAAFYIILGGKAMLYGLFSLVLGVLYSYHGVRLKSIAFLDLLSHCWLLAGLQTLTGYYTFTDEFTQTLLFPLLFVICVSLYGQLFNEIRDFDGDKRTTMRHTAIVLGEKRAHFVMLAVLALGAICGVITFFFLKIIPLWVIMLMVVLALIMGLPALLKIRSGVSSMEIQTPLHKPLERAAAIALLVGYLAPVLMSLFS